MKYNKIVKENEYNKNSFLITCVCTIVLLLTLCYFGVNSTAKRTLAADTCSCSSGTKGSFVITKLSGSSMSEVVRYDNHCVTAIDTKNCYVTAKDSGAILTETCSQYDNKYYCVKTGTEVVYQRYKKCTRGTIVDYCDMQSDTGCGSLESQGYTCDWVESDNYSCTQYTDFGEQTCVDDSAPTLSCSDYNNTSKAMCESLAGCKWNSTGSAGGTCTVDSSDSSSDVTTKKCWQCNSPATIFHWGTSGSNAQCQSGWHERTDYTNQSDCESQKFTVTYNANGGSVSPTTQTVVDGKKTTLPTPTKSGYTFKGWYIDSTSGSKAGDAGDEYTVSGNVTLVAKWELIPVEKCWQCNSPATIFHWGTSSSGGDSKCQSEWHEINRTKENCTYIAPKNYVITYDANGGSVSPTTQTVADGSQATLLRPTRTGYTFKGWYIGSTSGSKAGDAGDEYTVSGNVTLVAKWELIPVEKCWQCNSPATIFHWGTSSSDGDSKCQSEWHEINRTKENCKYIAPKNYVITYDANGGSVSPETQTVADGSQATLLRPTRTGYTFKGWYIGSTSGSKAGDAGDEYTVSGNVTLVAKWAVNTYTVTYNANDGSVKCGTATTGAATCTENVNYGSSPSLPTPTRNNYDFVVWHVGTVSGTKVGTDYKVTGNVTLVAEWKVKSSGGSPTTKKTFTANFNPNGGSLTTSGGTLTCSGVSSCTISKGIPSASRECFVFKGWGTSQSCTSGDLSSVTLTKTPTTFYACWVKDSSCDNNPDPGTGNDPDPTPGTNPEPGKDPEPTPEPDENVTDNPPTGGVTTIAIIWFCGLLAIGYAFYYFKSVREN